MFRRISKMLSVIFCLLAAALLVANWLLTDYLETPLELQRSLTIKVPAGTSLTAQARQMEKEGLLKWSRVLTVYGRLSGQTGIKAGEYLLHPGDTPRELLAKWVRGDVIQYSLTFPEGLTFSDWLLLLANVEKLEQVLTPGSQQHILEQLGAEISHPEGWFFPDTYSYSEGDTDRDILLRAHQRMREVLAEEWSSRSSGLPYDDPYEALIMASIIEKETGVAEERGQIAGVFVRRLQKGMRLQTDPTVIYGLGDAYKGNIRRKHLRQHSDYNTYLIKGLPPTPIAMPGREAIHAALHPEDGNSLFFVAKGDGSHYFSATLEEHQKAVREFQLQRRSDYRSQPK
ncbi:MAG: endolytic transglycosylase MltG [Gammaproteobacteria bacterium]|nr:MAG: endolytic transglycosylase MltG [Gammaproteobacteria bacterium]